MNIDKKKVAQALTFLWAKCSGWLLAELCVFWEDYLCKKLKNDVDQIVSILVYRLKKIRSTKEYEAKRDELFDKMFENVKLPVILKPFKGVIKKILRSNIDKKLDGLLNRLDKTI